MNNLQKIISILLSALLCVGMVACKNDKDYSSKEKVADDSSKTATVTEKFSTTASDYTYDLECKNWNEEGITVKYPLVVNSNDQDKSDVINDLLMDDMSNYIDAIKSNIVDKTGLTIDAVYDYANYSISVLSINYRGTYFADKMVYPVNFYHTITINTEDAKRIQLSDLFNINDNFIETYKMGIYAPYIDDLDLEASGVSIEDVLKDYSNDDLIEMFKSPDAEYFLAEQGVIISIPVQHVIGDHFEIAINFELVEDCFNKGNPVWQDYMFLTVENGDSDESGWSYYGNPRFDFVMGYPDIFTEATEPDNSDGITMKSADGKYELLMWGAHNIDESTGDSMLADAKSRVSNITDDYSDKDFYSITYEGERNGEVTEFVGNGFVTPEKTVQFLISYPTDEKEHFLEIIKQMQSEISLGAVG